MALSVRAHRYTTVPARETLSDASAGPFEEDSITYPLCQQLVDDFFLVEEEDIAEGIRWMLDHERKLIEGSAAVALAPLLLYPERWADQRSVVVLCGGNISREKLRSVLA
jgi:threonine dehydratase